MRQLIFSWFFLLTAALPAQEKGAAPLNPQSLIRNPESTRAVVVGISDYQSTEISDLRFAHRDAEAFADWLKSVGGGSVPEDNIRLLTNAQATTAAIVYAMIELVDSCRAGEQVVIYFSGHGDVESKLRNQPGFLLTYDSPPRVYVSNAVGLRDLNDIVLKYDIVPGKPDQSILHYRMHSLQPGVAMPELGRKMAHTEGLALITDWISEME